MGSIRGEGGAGGGGGGGIADLVDDTTPQLGGNLDVNGFNVGGATPTQVGYLAATTAAGAALLDDANAAAQRTTLGLGTAAVAASGDFQAANANLTALAGQTGAADNVSYWTAAATLALAALTAFGRSLIAAADAAGVRTLLGLGTAATTDASAYQAADAELTAIAGLTSAADRVPYFTGSGAASLATFTAAGRALVDDADAAAQLVTLGAVGAASPTLTGTVVIRQTAGVAGTDEIQISHDGTNGTIENKDGKLILKSASSGLYIGGVSSSDLVITVASGILKFRRADNSNPFTTKIAYLMDNPTNNNVEVPNSYGYAFASGSDPESTGPDTSLRRESAAVVAVKNGTGSAYGGFKATQYQSTVTTGTAPFTVASTTVVANLNADKLDGKDATDFAPCTQATLTAGASVALDFAAAGLATLTTNQNTTFTTSNRAAGRQPYNLRILGGGAHTLTFPAGWKWLNSTMPAAIASGKTGRLCLECYGSADTDVVASFAVEA